MPLPGATRARETLLRIGEVIGASSQSTRPFGQSPCKPKLDGSRAIPRKTRGEEAGGPGKADWPSRDFGIELRPWA